jgi:PTS system nitrogen regulatory IIA component
VIRELLGVLSEDGSLSDSAVDGIAKSIIARERTKGTTGFGKGVAAPHVFVPGLTRVMGAVGLSSRGIDFASLDGAPVHIVFLILSPHDQHEAHLRAMDLVFRHLQQERFRRFLRQCERPEQIMELFREADERLLVS